MAIDPTKVASAGEVLLDGASSSAQTAGTDLVSGASDLASLFSDEPICPVIPGLPAFPELPSIEDLGQIADDALEDAEALVNRIKMPPSPEDLMKEFKSGASDAATKLKTAAEAAAKQILEFDATKITGAYDDMISKLDPMSQALEAVQSGAIDISSITSDAMALPGAALEGAFAGFKNAKDCLLGEPGSAEAEFNAKSEAASEGLEAGRGASAIIAEDVEETSTAKPVPKSDNPIIPVSLGVSPLPQEGDSGPIWEDAVLPDPTDEQWAQWQVVDDKYYAEKKAKGLVGDRGLWTEAQHAEHTKMGYAYKREVKPIFKGTNEQDDIVF